MNEIAKARLALLPVLAERAVAGHIGRTALMKYMYFLQKLRGMRLGYDFSLYSYGPFDSDVLSDLSSAEALKIVDVSTVEFNGGYGYRIRPGSAAEAAKRAAGPFLREHSHDLDWLFRIFGSFNSAQLELASTIVYVDREMVDVNERQPVEEVVSRVKEIKPHFSKDEIRRFVGILEQQGVLTATIRGN